MVLTSCIEPIDPNNIAFDDLLVIDGLVTDEVVNQEIILSRTKAINDRTFFFERGARVWIEDSEGARINFSEESNGRYVTQTPYGVPVGGSVQLFIETESGRQYESLMVDVLPTDAVDSIFAEFTSEPVRRNTFAGRFNFFLDARNNQSDNRFFRWDWNYTFEFSTSTPSRWLFINNEFINRDRGSENDSLQVEVCWQTFENKDLNLIEVQTPEIGVTRLPLYDFHSEEGFMKKGFSMELEWYALSQTSYNYWKLVDDFNQEQGSLADLQPGTIVGNVRSISNPQEIVLGRFDAVQIQRLRRHFDREDFFNAGFRVIRGDFIDCADFDPVSSADTIEAVDSTLNVLGDEWVLSYFGNSTAFFLPKRCAECTEFGSNKRPEFWE